MAKLASVKGKKLDGLLMITHENIDEILKPLKLGDLPGIGANMSYRLERAGIMTPLAMRYARPHKLKAIFKSIEGVYWHYRLKFIETNIVAHEYRHAGYAANICRKAAKYGIYRSAIYDPLPHPGKANGKA